MPKDPGGSGWRHTLLYMQTVPRPSQQGSREAPPAPVDGWRPPVEQPAHREQLDGARTNVCAQFRSDRALTGLARVLDATAKAQYFRRAGLLEAARYSLNPGAYRPIIRVAREVGLRPQDVQVVEHQHW
jgi:hypothetical protein